MAVVRFYITGAMFLTAFLSLTPVIYGEPAFNELPSETYILPGDLYIGVLQIMHTYSDTSMCSSRLSSMKYQQNVPAALYQVAQINRDPNLLQNVTLGLIQVDCCSKPVTAVGQALTVLDARLNPGREAETNGQYCLGHRQSRKIVGFVGPLPSVVSMSVSSVFNLYRTPIISSTASSDELTDRSKYRYLYRMVPPDSFQARVMVDLLVHYNWSYISVVHEENTYGFNGLKYIRRLTSANDICIAESYALADSFVDEDFDVLVERLRFHKKARVVIVFALTHKMRAFLRAVYRRNTTDFVLVLSETATRDSFRGVESVLEGSFSVQWFIGSWDADKEAYIASISPQTEPGNPWIRDVWQQYLSCDNVTTSPCSEYTFGDIPGYSRYPTTYQLTQGIQVYALALDALLNERCPEAKRNKSLLDNCVNPEHLLDYVSNVRVSTASGSLAFTEEGAMIRDYQLQQLQFRPDVAGYAMVPVGLWTHSQKKLAVKEASMKWDILGGNGGKTADVPESVCAKPCAMGEFYIQGELPCCWDCHPCRSNEFVAENATTCRTCALLTWPDQETFTTCRPIEPNYLSWLDIYALTLMGLAAIGAVLNMIVLFCTIIYRHRRVIKGAVLEIVAIIILGLFMALATVPLFIAKPSNILCVFNRIGFHLSCTLVYGPLMVKTNRVYQVFAAAAKLSRTVRYATRTSQMVAIIVIIGIQV